MRPDKPGSTDAAPVDLAEDRERALALVDVSRETADRLDGLVALLLRWQRTMNLVAPSTIPVLWTRHIADSLQLVALAPAARIWIDLGSGGGFPGLVIACALADVDGAQVHLVESNGKKAAFLREAARHLCLPVVVHHRRIEDFVKAFNQTADVVTARALSPLLDLLGYAQPLINSGAQGLFPKGQDVDAELTQAAKYWNIVATLVPSRTDPRGRVVVVRRAERRTSDSRNGLDFRP
ncbi:MAG: 16S rRNA (guanine(527)-N(7))-methyltransferase RsmG [Xanthobacteraceae bacterium]